MQHDESGTGLRVFVNYRRDDSGGYALSLHRDLTAHFGEGRVFMDVDSIAPGENFVKRIDETLGSCDVVVALIGRDWVDAADEEGRRRLADPEDFVRLELEKALSRNIPLVPTLVHGGRVPRAGDLPEELRPVVEFHAFDLRESSWDSDVERLVGHLERLAGRSGEEGSRDQPRPTKGVLAFARRRWKWLAVAALAVVAAIAAGAVLAGSGSSSTAPIGPPGEIAYVNGGQLYVMDQNGDGSKAVYPHQLQTPGFTTATSDFTFYVHPTWSPDRRHIALANGGDIYVVDAKGRARNLTRTPDVNEDSPSWSPDGKQIVFESSPKGRTCNGKRVCERVSVMNADGSNARTLEGSGGATSNFDYGPAWSPDGKLIAFSSTAGLGAGRYAEIWVMNADGSDAHAITNLGGWNSWPAWSPNGQRLAFQSTSAAPDFASCNPRDTCLSRVMTIDSTGLGQASPFPALPGGATALSPVWLDNRTVMFGSSSSASTYDLWVSDGTTLRQITTNGGSTDAAVAP